MPTLPDIRTIDQLRLSGDLPSPKGVALAIIKLTRQSEVSLAELARVISGDPAFVGRLIKAANGIVMFTRRSVASVNEALMVLGLPAVRTMALGFSLLSDYRKGCAGFDYERFWSHALALAVANQVFAHRSRAAAADELFSLGLLTRVGELALATVYPEPYAGLLARVAQDPTLDLLDLERDTFALTHTELGRAMLSDWGLPGVFVDVAAQFDDPDPERFEVGSRSRKLLVQLDMSRQLASIWMGNATARRQRFEILLARGAELGVERADIVADADRIGRMWLEWGHMLRFTLPDAVPLEDLVSEEAPGLVAGERAGAATASATEVPVSAPPPKVSAALATVAAPPRVLAPRTVLVVEQDAAQRQRAGKVVASLGLRPLEVADCQVGLERALEVLPVIILLGDVASDGDALELVRALRQTRPGKSMYVLVVGDGADDEALVRALEAGADDAMARPAVDNILAARLRAALRVVDLQAELKQEREELRRYAAELAVASRQHQEAAMTDALTGFYNRRYATERIKQAWAYSDRDNSPLSCIVFDFDGLKGINDVHGHAAGDAALKAAAVALKAGLRRQDVICRMGGDEFLVICPNAALAEALTCAERLRFAVGQRVLEFGDASVRLSVSVGVAQREAGIGGPDDLVRLADMGAYRAKEQGRNRIVAVQLGGASGA